MRTPLSGESADDILKRNRDLQMHLAALGLATVEQYAHWCTCHGFRPRIDKHWRELARERFLVAQQAVKQRLAQSKLERRNPRRALERIFAGDVEQHDLKQPRLKLLHQTFTGIEDDDARQDFVRLVLHLEGRTGLITPEPAVARLGERPGNTFIEALAAEAGQHVHWLRAIDGWSPRTHNVERQFSSLARHLLAKYPIPAFMDSVWFRGQSPEASQQHASYRELSGGRSPRDLALPFKLSRQMAGHFQQAPREYLLEEALRWGQVRGLGGGPRLVRAILGSRIAASFEQNDFWTTVIRWLVQNPLFDPRQIAPLIDYIHHQKFVPAGGSDGPPAPDFSVQGRTATALLQRVRDWHGQLRQQPVRVQQHWLPSGISPFDWSEGLLAAGTLRRWTIIELTSRRTPVAALRGQL